jgi:sugar phosphate isomerase/epimerase
MRYVYFSKFLQRLDLKGMARFCKDVGLDGIDLTVRPGYPVTPENAVAALPDAVKLFRDEGLVVGLVSAPTDMADPEDKAARAIFEAAGKAGVAAVKPGYFLYRPPFEACLKEARQRLAGFARLAERSGARVCYHTHSGSMLGNNCASLRMLLEGLDPHHVGAYVDTGHTAINGGPIGMELDTVKPWLSLLAIKDMLWQKHADKWSPSVVPAGQGIVRWEDVGAAVRKVKFNGTVSLHGEYETKDLDERRRLAQQELAFLKKVLP